MKEEKRKKFNFEVHEAQGHLEQALVFARLRGIDAKSEIRKELHNAIKHIRRAAKFVPVK